MESALRIGDVHHHHLWPESTMQTNLPVDQRAARPSDEKVEPATPEELDAAQLHQVGGGLAPNGTWAAATTGSTEAPNGTW